MKSFVYDICQYLDTNSSFFSFGIGDDKSLKIGELVRDKQGVFAMDMSPESPDMESPLEYHTIDFWAQYTDQGEAQEMLLIIYNLFHMAHHYNTNSYTIQFSHATTPIMDMDRDGEGRKLLKLSVRYILTTIIS